MTAASLQKFSLSRRRDERPLDPPRTCGGVCELCGRGGRELCWSERRRAWCCHRCHHAPPIFARLRAAWASLGPESER